ncbi:hypothetical protein IVB27_10420 [Bradyrhizobium sp. 197]|jgi:hypothetical protein|uniref:hypothetical protein n=1 Tax=Bradyrhizobium sp. 197 TaxID=2782663 RepID=UPI001FF71BFD|nr:hypothetical protein [Bradyrhizobium sp. 197]MCK1475201.1 hypothetical protein [Bradyrhizobium sp. 197]
MKKIIYALATVALLGVPALTAPAAALPGHPALNGIARSEAIGVRYHYVPRKVCTTRTVVTRGYHGRRIVKRVRVCR